MQWISPKGGFTEERQTDKGVLKTVLKHAQCRLLIGKREGGSVHFLFIICTFSLFSLQIPLSCTQNTSHREDKNRSNRHI